MIEKESIMITSARGESHCCLMSRFRPRRSDTPAEAALRYLGDIYYVIC